MKTPIFILLLAGILWSGPGCARSDPRLQPIRIATQGEYERWRMMASDLISGEEWREFDESLQELRLRIMADREATGHAEIESALRSKIHGATFREILIVGAKAKIVRLTLEREEVRRVMNGNARKSVLLGDAEFERVRALQEKRMLSIDDEILRAKRRLAQFGHYQI